MPLQPRPPSYYDELAASLRRPRRPPDPTSVREAAQRLDAMLAHAIQRVDSVEAKAGLIPAAVAGVVTLLAGRIVKDLPPGTVLVGGLAVAAAVAATLLALWVREPIRMNTGPDPITVAQATGDDDPLPRDQGMVDSLAVAVENVEDVLEVKADRFNLAIGVGVAGILLVAIFAALGGIR